MSTGLAWIIALTLAQSPDASRPAREIQVHRRLPLALLLSTPSGVSGQTRTSQLLDAVSQQVETYTDFFIQSLEPQQSSACQGRLACIVQRARPDYQRIQYDLGNGEMAPFSEHLDYLDRKKVIYPRYLLLVTNISGEVSDRMSITVVDTNVVLATIHELGPVRPEAATAIALAIREKAHLYEPVWHEVGGPAEASALLAQTFREKLRGPLEQSGHWLPYGAIDIHTDEGGHEIRLDGVALGSTAPGLTRISGVNAGTHRVRLTRPDLHPWHTDVDVMARDTAELQVTMLVASDPQALAIRQITQWSGVGLVLAGAVMTSVAIAKQDRQIVSFCITPDVAQCAGDRFTSIRHDPGRAPTTGSSVNPDGLLLGPLGYSLMLTGATWSLGTLLFEDDTEIPWWQIGAGVAVGALSYGLSAALNPESPNSGRR